VLLGGLFRALGKVVFGRKPGVRLRDKDRRDESGIMLAEVYNWFTEGFKTLT